MCVNKKKFAVPSGSKILKSAAIKRTIKNS